MGAFMGIAVFFLFRLAASYFSFTLRLGRPIRLGTVFSIYLAGTMLFAMVYYFAFLAEPKLFQFDAKHIHWFATVGSRSVDSWGTKLLFLLYSALKSVGGTLPYLESNSVLASVCNYVQSLFTFCLVSLLFAGYVNQKTSRDA